VELEILEIMSWCFVYLYRVFAVALNLNIRVYLHYIPKLTLPSFRGGQALTPAQR